MNQELLDWKDQRPLVDGNSLRLIDFAASKNMAIRSIYFQHSLPYRYTWRSPQQTESQIDHVLIVGRHFSDITEVRTYRYSDYYPVERICPNTFTICFDNHYEMEDSQPNIDEG